MSGFFNKLFSSNNQEKPATTEAGFIESIFGTKKETKTAEEPAPATTEAAPAAPAAADVKTGGKSKKNKNNKNSKKGGKKNKKNQSKKQKKQ